jgi:hypothetical protein
MLAATYVSGSSFTVIGNHEVLFVQYTAIKCVQGVDGTIATHVESSSYSAGTGLTTVIVTAVSLTANLTNVLTSYVSAASLPSTIPQKVGGAAGQIPIADIASGTPDGTKFVKDDGTLAVPAGSQPTGTGFPHIVDGVRDAAAKLVQNDDVHASAGIVESKLALNNPTHANTNDPTTDQKAALAGTGTPSALNKFTTADYVVPANVPTADQKAALAGTGTPSSGNKFATEDYVTPANVPSADEKAALVGTSGTATSGTNKLVDNADTRLDDARTPVEHGSSEHDSSVASLSDGKVPTTELGGAGADNTKVLYGDQTWAVPPGASGGEANTMSSVDNAGSPAGVALYDSKSGVDLKTKSLDGSQFEVSGSHEIKIKDSVLGGGGGGVIRGTFATRPAAGTAGRLHLPTDGYYPAEDTGSVWVPHPEMGSSIQVVGPTTGIFTKVGGDTETTMVTDGDGVLLTQMGTNSTALNLVTYLVSLPAAPYSLVVGIDLIRLHLTAAAYLGLCLSNGNTTSNNLITYALKRISNTIYDDLEKNTNYAAFGSAYFSGLHIHAPVFFTKFFLRLRDDNTTRYYEMSPDGRNWTTIHSVGRTDYITPTYGGIFIGQGTSAVATTLVRVQAKIFHWALG